VAKFLDPGFAKIILATAGFILPHFTPTRTRIYSQYGKGKLVPVLKELSSTPWRRMGSGYINPSTFS
jgi:hypothetical protein